jgi:hypothetical protein
MDHTEQLIRTYVHLPNQSSGTGWYPVLCKVCNDHGRKGPRGGFKFEDSGFAYHCFNCGHKATYYPHYKSVPKDANKVLNAFGVPQDEVNKLRLEALKQKDKHGQLVSSKKKEELVIQPKELPLPDHFYPLIEAKTDDKWAEIARLYLEDRKIDYTQYPFYLSTGIPKRYLGPESQKAVFIKYAQKWKKRIIIPIYKDGNLVFYQGRDMTGRALKKYESPSTPKDRVLYGFDQLFTNEDRPLYIMEGFFDAFPINGIALLGNELTKPQISWINMSLRDKVYIPDKGKSGFDNGIRALEEGWRVSTPDIGNCKDINDAIVKYGRLYVHDTLKNHTKEGFEAETALRLYCKIT